MQEVTIKPRSAFKHAVSVDGGGKELCWNFCTRKKNISFGLYKKIARNSADIGKYTLASGSQYEVGKDILVVVGGDDEPSSTPPSPKPTIIPRVRSSVASPFAMDSSMSAQLSPMDGMPRDTSSLRSMSELGDSPSSTGPSLKRGKNKFHDPELVEIVPVAHYESSKFTVKGCFYIEEPGTYVLVFDNSFSVNTSKKLFFFVALRDVEPAQASPRKEFEGWLMKKGNRKMQGYQKRWVRIDSDGTLSYYKHAGSFSRGTVALVNAAVRLDHDHRLIDIDSGQNLYHFKARSAQDFRVWTGVIEKFAISKSLTMDMDVGTTDALFSDAEFHTATGSQERELDDIQRRSEGIVSNLQQEVTQLKGVVDGLKAGSKGGKDQAAAAESLSDLANQVVTDARELHQRILNYSQNARLQRERQQVALRQLEGVLQACLVDNNRVRQRLGMEEVTVNTFAIGGSTTSVHVSDTERSSYTAASRDVFFDAETWETQNENDDDEEDSGDEHDYGSPDEFEEDEQSNGSTPAHSREPSGREPNGKLALNQNGVIIMESSAEVLPEQQAASSTQAPAPEAKPKTVARRTKLPATTVSMQGLSLMSILRNNMGKDLSTVAMPIALNEPINLLQKLCEELEYCELLDRAAKTTDTVERLCLVAAFSISAYASTVNRVGRKPFNPLLGETYEFIREDKGFKFVSEKVSHHPPVMACYAESPNYVFFQESLVKSKFWGKSMELIPTGTVHVAFPKLTEHYTWGKVTTCMRNIFSTSRYLEHYGTMKIMAHGSGHYCEVAFKESGYFASAKNEIVGTVYGPSGQKLMSLSGQWDKSIQKFHESAPNSLEVLWRARPCPPHHADMYGFTQFTAELNELTPDLDGSLPNTDTRYRPDQRMYEEGRAEEAEREKSRLEQKQREYRKQLETEGRAWTPQWFEFKAIAYGDDAESWQYRGGYFEKRGKFEKKIDLW